MMSCTEAETAYAIARTPAEKIAAIEALIAACELEAERLRAALAKAKEIL